MHFAINITVNPFKKVNKYTCSHVIIHTDFIILYIYIYIYVGSKIAKDSLHSYFYSENYIGTPVTQILHIALCFIKSNVHLLKNNKR